MIAALLFLLPISLGGAISPMMLTEQTVLLAGARGRRAASGYAAGAILTLLAIVVVLVFFGHVISLPTAPTLSASLDLFLGLMLLSIGMAIRYLGHHPLRRPRRPGPPERAHRPLTSRARATVPFGAFSMATNFTTLAIVVVAAKEIAGADVGTVGRIALILVLVTVCSSPAWAPLALTRLAPDGGSRVLERIRGLIDEYGRAAIVVVLAGAGAFLIARGLFHL